MGPRFIILPLIIILTSILLGWWYINPAAGLIIIGLLLCSYCGAAWWLDTQRTDWWRVAGTPWLLAVSFLLFSLLLSRGWLLVSLLVVLVILETIYWRYVVNYSDLTATYTPFSLERLSFNLNFLIVYFISASFYGLRTFLDIPLWWITPTFALIFGFLIIQRLWITKTYHSLPWRLAISLFICLTEVFLLVSFLPLDFRILAFIVTSVYYGLVSLSNREKSTKETKLSFWILLVIVLLSSLAVIATARWY